MKIKPYLKHLVRECYLEEHLATKQQELLNCSLGVNPAGAPERVVEAAKQYRWSGICYYPDHTYKDLRERIVEFWSSYADLEIGQIQISHGVSGVLERVTKIFVDPGSRVLGYIPQWPDYEADVKACGGKYEAVRLNSEESFKFHAGRLVAKISKEYCLIYIDNPNNPTGQIISLEEIEEIVRQAQGKEIVVVIDEAYGDFTGKENSAISLMNRYGNLVVLRSFSKGFGIAGLRVGYGVFPPELSQYYDKVAFPCAVSTVSCYLARVALSDEDFLHSCRERVQREKTKLIDGLRGKGYLISETSKSCPIFLLGHKDRDINLKEELLDKGILTVGGGEFRNLGNNYVRVNTPAKAEEFLTRLE